MKSQHELYNLLSESGAFGSSAIARAFRSIDRRDFVPEEHAERAYLDYPLPIGFGQTISQPSTVTIMLSMLDPQKSEKILDIGSGSGWTTALLAHIVGEKGKVIGVELIPDLVLFGQTNLSKYDFPHAKIIQAKEGTLGYLEEAPYDRILVSAAGQKLPQELVDQLKVGGRMVIPIGNAVWQIDKVSETEIDEKVTPGFVFVPLVQH